MTGQSRVAGLAFAAMLLSAYPPNRLTAQDPWPVLDHASQTYQTIANLSADFVQVVANPMIGAPDTTRRRLDSRRPARRRVVEIARANVCATATTQSPNRA